MSDGISLKRILVPLDGSDSAFRAAEYAVMIAKPENAEIIFMHAVVNPSHFEYKTLGARNRALYRRSQTTCRDVVQESRPDGFKARRQAFY